MDAKYELTYAVDGQPIYRKNGKRTKRTNIPKEELVKLQGPAQEDETVDPPPIEAATVKLDSCLVCGEPATRTRFANLQTLHVCEDHYFKSTLGSLVIKLREVGEYEPVLPTN